MMQADEQKQESRSLLSLLTVADMEDLFRVDRRTISRWCKKSYLPAPFKVGGSKRWRRGDITQAIEKMANHEL